MINQDRQERAQMMQARLERLGVQVRIEHYTDDSAFPEEYTLTYGDVRGVGPTMDLAVSDFVEALLLKKATR